MCVYMYIYLRAGDPLHFFALLELGRIYCRSMFIYSYMRTHIFTEGLHTKA